MAVLVNNVPITIAPGDSAQSWQGNIANNADTLSVILTRLPADNFVPGEVREVEAETDYSTDGGTTWSAPEGMVFREAVDDNQIPLAAKLTQPVPRSPGRRLRVTVTRHVGTVKFNVFAEIV